MGNNDSEHRKQHGSIIAPIGQDFLNFRVAKAEEAQGGAVVWDRIKDRVNFSDVDGQLPPAGRAGRWRFGGQAQFVHR